VCTLGHDQKDLAMTDPFLGCAAPTDLQRAIATFRRHAFAALLAGQRPRLADITEAVSRDTLGVAPAVAWLEDHGQLERDGEMLVGAHGLTRRTTPHTLTIGERTLHTWCAYDAVAIPVALGATARATTTCPACHEPVVVDIGAGHLPETDTPVLWMPIGPCERVIDDFCPHANLFCTGEHVEDWRRSAGDPDGQVVTFADVPALADAAWADIAIHG
jgi:alkylmercury lyase